MASGEQQPTARSSDAAYRPGEGISVSESKSVIDTQCRTMSCIGKAHTRDYYLLD